MVRAPYAPLILAATVLLMALGLLSGALPDRDPPRAGPTDLGLYAQSIQAARHPSTWYATVVAEQRREGYPLKPFVTVRPPALAFALAPLPGEAARRLVLGALAVAVLAVWAVRLMPLGPLCGGCGVLLLATGLAPAVAGQAYLMHETWAGLLIALSLGLWRPDGFALSLAAGLCAALIRELAAPYLLVMAMLALTEGRRREAAAWSIAFTVFAAALALHAHGVAQAVLPSDPRGPGWLGLGGWPFALHAFAWNAVLSVSPVWLAALAVPAALLGALAWGGPLGARLATTLIGFAAGLLILGRPENAYWGLIVAPLLPLGLLMAPKAVRCAFRRRAPALTPSTVMC